MKLCQLARPLTILFLSFMVSACSHFKTVDDSPSLNESAIAQNLLYTLSMLKEVSPWQTAVQVSKPSTDFGHHVESGLVELGYAIRRVSADQGRHYVRYAGEQVHDETGKYIRYRVAIGDVSVERFYDVDGTLTYPISVMTVKGAAAQEVALNDAIFKHGMGGSVSSVSFIRDNGSEDILHADTGSGSAIEKSAPKSTNKLTLANAAALDPATKKNMYETRESNFSAVFVNYRDVKREILVFPNDSLFLDDHNREIIAQYANSIRSDEDVISLIGCSHGKSNLNNGNSLLALGRANRVKEVLLSVGLKEEQVLDEGCWAPVHFDEMMPRRGVVMTLKRPKA